jgi:hypothetical protein
MPRWAENMSPQYRAFTDFVLDRRVRSVARALGDAPFRKAVVLSLYRAEQADDLTRPPERLLA